LEKTVLLHGFEKTITARCIPSLESVGCISASLHPECIQPTDIVTVTKCVNLHIVATYDVQPKHDLLNSLTRAVYSLKAVVQYQVDCLIKSFQCSLQTNTASSSAAIQQICKCNIPYYFKMFFLCTKNQQSTLLRDTYCILVLGRFL